MKGVSTNECPVSFLDKAPKDIALVKLWQKAERIKTTLGTLLGSDDAWIEDVEDLLAALQDELKHTYDEHREKLVQFG